MNGYLETMEGTVQQVATVAYFIMFYLTSVVIVMNVVVAFFLETFMVRMSPSHEDQTIMFVLFSTVKRVVILAVWFETFANLRVGFDFGV
jgi:hypothetical protein